MVATRLPLFQWIRKICRQLYCAKNSTSFARCFASFDFFAIVVGRHMLFSNIPNPYDACLQVCKCSIIGGFFNLSSVCTARKPQAHAVVIEKVKNVCYSSARLFSSSHNYMPLEMLSLSPGLSLSIVKCHCRSLSCL